MWIPHGGRMVGPCQAKRHRDPDEPGTEDLPGEETPMSTIAAVIRSRAVVAPALVPALAFVALTALLAAHPIAVAAAEAPTAQTITIHDARSGDGPCGFVVERTIDGTVALIPSIDAAGNLVLEIEPVTLHGTLTNPATGKSVDLRWVQSNGVTGFGQDSGTMTVTWALDGHFLRGYDRGRTDLTMALPVDGA